MERVDVGAVAGGPAEIWLGMGAGVVASGTSGIGSVGAVVWNSCVSGIVDRIGAGGVASGIADIPLGRGEGDVVGIGSGIFNSDGAGIAA